MTAIGRTWPAERGRRVAMLRTGSVTAAAALGLPGLVSLLALGHVSTAVPRVLYIAAIAAAALAGTVAGLAAAAASFVAFDYFFTPPYHSFAVHGADGVSLAVFLAVGIAVGQLVAREREARLQAADAATRMRRLEAVVEALARARTPQEVLDAVLTEGLEAAEARGGLIGLLAADGQTIEVVAQRGYDHVSLAQWGRFGLADPVPLSEAVRTARPVYLSSATERDRRYPALAEATEMEHALVCLPLLVEGRTLGSLVLRFPIEQELDASRHALRESVAAQTAAALDRTRLDEAERRLRERLAFVAEASALLASSLDYQRTLSRLAELCVPRLADWCAIDMLAEDGSIERLAVAHSDPAKVRYALELAERYPPDPDAPTGVPHVLRTGEPELVADIPDELLVDATRGDEELLRIVRELGLRSAITVPLAARGRTLGALSLVDAESGRRYTPDDLELALDLARRAAVCVDNARLHAEAERRADAARALEHVADGVLLADRSGTPRYWNLAAGILLDGERPLAHWAQIRKLLAQRDSEGAAPLILPIELEDGERWLQISRVAFDEGSVYAIRDVTEERLLDRTRSEFVATASHELRTPIAAVYGAFQTLLRDDVELPAEQRERFLRMGRDESERLARIVDDLLLAGQLDGGSPKLRLGECEVGPLIDELVASTAARLDGSHAFAVDVDPGVHTVACDPLRLRQVLANLVENAIKYSPEGGTVTVTATGANRSVLIAVRDEGLGIADGDRARIFDRFVRLDPALRRGVGGTGLGLYISRELVERMHGRITVRSQEGEGSTFVVELPGA